ncbi:MAG TPA: adenylate/guanylate cyclase domain-containing protein [Candidatus Dormibacteraeota bacterium]|nr:adenylate/guanylate cyclase domain-containing protein [Candidatus Dormibacteraeota bacterium]
MCGAPNPGTMVQANLDNALTEGRDAVRRHAWREAYERLRAADQAGSLEPDDLEGLAEAAWWNGRAGECVNALERAFAGHLEAGRPRNAALDATRLARQHSILDASAVANAWLNRAQRLLQDESVGVEHGYLTRMLVGRAMGAREYDRALELAQQMLDIGTKFGDRDLIALGLHYQGLILVEEGQVKEGMALLDESTVAAVSGEVTPHNTAAIYCNLIGVCEEMADYRRAAEWTAAASRWCDRMAIAGFPGMCRVHRADVIRLRGAWHEAELEARSAIDELREFQVAYAAEAQYLIAETKLWMGDLTEARDAFQQAHELGRDPNPGLALLQLAEGKTDAAVAAIRRGLDKERRPLARARLLAAQVSIAQAAGDSKTVEAAASELNQTANTYGPSALKAQAARADGVASAMRGDSGAAVRHFCAALSLWKEVDVPYEEAKVRVDLAAAYRTGGDIDGAVLELRAARAVFARLGAALNDRDVVRMLAELGEQSETHPAASETATRTFLFTDIVRSTALVEAMGDEAWNEVLHWHDQTLRRLIAQHGGEEIKNVGDGVFAGFPQPEHAIECAVQIQRTLADHRRDHGFAPQVRIGVHRSPATRVGKDYRGKGVHHAARIADVGQGGEIVASLATAQPCKFAISEPREVALKGVSQPVQVVTIAWR